MTAFLLTVTGPPDALGRRSFDLEWKDPEGRPRGQCFRAVVSQHVESLRTRGHAVEVVEQLDWQGAVNKAACTPDVDAQNQER